MPTTVIQQRRFDARPDRVDYRDREYQPPLVSLPERFPDLEFIAQHLPHYTASGLMLDQGQEGACTGFGLAAVINYLLWRRSLSTPAPVAPVSPRMLYHMARIYDEWPGEDYEGSSCRGAMKGWHRHGVCTDALWPYRTRRPGQFVAPKRGWQQDASTRPLGAYYRVNKDAISDLQAAIHEVGALYASAVVHPGWFLGTTETLASIEMQAGETGGHAFALVGYTPDGFIVQNSWGPQWGYQGFAVLTYEDWIQHGTDAWVAVLGAPMAVRTSARTRSSMALRDVADGKATWFWDSHSVTPAYAYRNPAVAPFTESTAYEHTVVLGNNGRPLNQFLDVADAQKAVQEVTLTLPRQWLSQHDAPRLALYAHGGLNNEDVSLRRIRVMAPYFKANGIYPLFVTWRTGFLESVENMLGDVVEQFVTPGLAERERGWFSEVKQQITEARDRTIEVACEQLLVKAVWMQMKQNALAAQTTGLALMANHLATLKKQLPQLEIHLVGHSAGAILLGYLLDHLVGKQLPVATLSLYAPACTVRFALQHYATAHAKRLFVKQSVHVDLLSDERERADTVGPYGKSLLYLVSRSLEEVHKMPLLGMEGVWHAAVDTPDMWQRDTQGDVKTWRQFVGETVPLRVHGKERAEVWDGQEHLPLAHGSFDNDLEVVTATLQRMRGGELLAAVENLHGF